MPEQPTNPPSPGVLRVTETFAESVPATRAFLHVVVDGSRVFTGGAALQQAAETRKLIIAVQAIGLEERDMGLESVEMAVSKGLFSKSSRASYHLRIQCSRLELLAELLDVVSNQDNCQLESIEWIWQEEDLPREDWLRTCARRALSRARALAEAVGAELGDPEELSAENLDDSPPERSGAPGREPLVAMRRVKRSIGDELGGFELAPTRRMGIRLRASFRIRPIR